MYHTDGGRGTHGHRWHMMLCVVIVAAGALVALGGIGGAWAPAMVTLGCVAMMGAMLWMMAGGRHDHDH